MYSMPWLTEMAREYIRILRIKDKIAKAHERIQKSPYHW